MCCTGKWSTRLAAAIAFFVVLYVLLWSFSLKGPRDMMLIAVALSLVITIYQYRTSHIRANFEMPLLKKIALLIITWVVVSSVASVHPLFSINKTLQLIPQFSPLLVIPYIYKERTLKMIVLAMTVTTGVLASYAIWQGVHEGLSRANGIGADAPFMLAYHLVFYILFALCCLFNHQLSKIHRYMVSLTIFLSAMALLFNGTRAAWIAALAGILLFIMIHSNRKGYLLSLVGLSFAGFVFVVFMSSQLQQRFLTLLDPNFVSNSERILMWKSALAMILDHPLLGVGVDNYFEYYHSYYISPLAQEVGIHRHPHNLILKTLCETGIIGLIPLVSLFVYILKTTYRRYRTNSNFYALAAFLATIALLIQAMLDYGFDQLSIMSYFWFIVGVGLYNTERGMLP